MFHYRYLKQLKARCRPMDAVARVYIPPRRSYVGVLMAAAGAAGSVRRTLAPDEGGARLAANLVANDPVPTPLPAAQLQPRIFSQQRQSAFIAACLHSAFG